MGIVASTMLNDLKEKLLSMQSGALDKPSYQQ